MAFATNASAFGMKPQTQTSGLFGSSQQQPSTTSFGSSNQGQNQSNLFGSTQNQQQPATGGGPFGQSTNQQTLPAGSLFGQSTQQPQQPQQQQQQQSTNTFGSGLFGSSTATQPGLTTNQPQQNTFGGFGSLGTNTQQQQQQQPAGGLFGGSTLGSNTQNGAFGGSTLGSNTGGFGGGGFAGGNSTLFGGAKMGQQQTGFQGSTAPAANALPFTKTTKFNDLPEDMKRVLEQIDTYIQGRVQISKDLHQRKLGEEPLKGQELIRNIHKDLINTASIIRNDAHVTQDLKAKVDQAVEDTIVATRIVDEFRNPQAGGTYRKDHAAFPLEFFTRVTDQMKERLAWYKSTIEAIERKLSASATQSQTPQGISATLQAQHQTFIALASKTAAVDAELQKIKALYTQLWRAKTGSVRDPFNDLDRSVADHRKGDLGMSGLSFR